MNRIWLTIRRIGLEIYCFFTAPFVVKNCLGMVTFLGTLLLLTLWWLRCYTNHGESVEVPDYVGMNYREAVRKARNSDFEVSIVDSVFVEGKAPGEVLTQNPKAKSQVKEGRTIYFTVAKGNADLVRLPGLVGNDDYDLYNRQCARLGVRTRVAGRVPDARLEPNTIVAVIYRGDTVTYLLNGGYQVETGAVLDFVVSEAASNTVSIPDCVCQTLSAARFLITSSSLNLGSVIKDGSVTDPETAYVWKQTPGYDANGTLKVGQTIDLFLTQEAPQGCQ